MGNGNVQSKHCGESGYPSFLSFIISIPLSQRARKSKEKENWSLNLKNKNFEQARQYMQKQQQRQNCPENSQTLDFCQNKILTAEKT